MKQPDDNTCIERTLSGDTASFAPLVTRYQGLVFSVALKVLRNSSDAEDVAQESFLKAFRSLSSFGGRAKFSTWLCQIVYNTASSYRRKKRPDKPGTELFANDLADEIESDDYDDRQALLRRVLSGLVPEDEILINLYYKYDKSVEEISSIINLSQSNVKVRLHRIRRKIYEEMKERMP